MNTLTEEVLLNLLNSFYKKEIDDIFSEEYNGGIQFKNLSFTCKKFAIETAGWEKVKSSLNNIWAEQKYFDVSRLHQLDRCYTLIIILLEDVEKLVTLQLCVSILIPYYSLVFLNSQKTNDRKVLLPPILSFDYNFEKKESITSLVLETKKKLENCYYLNEFPISLYNKIIPYVGFEYIKKNSFTYFDAFFYSGISNRI